MGAEGLDYLLGVPNRVSHFSNYKEIKDLVKDMYEYLAKFKCKPFISKIKQ